MRGTELVTYLQMEAENIYPSAQSLDSFYLATSDRYDIMTSVSIATAVMTDMDGSVDPAVPASFASLLSRLQSGRGRSIPVTKALPYRGLALLTKDSRVAITMGTNGVVESDGEDVSLVLERNPSRYISAFTIPGVLYPLKVSRTETIAPKWPTETIPAYTEEL